MVMSKKAYLAKKRAAQSESDPDGIEQHVPGAKLDAGKLDVFKMVFGYFAKALIAVGWLSDTGARKYSYGGWSAVDDAEARYTAACSRHFLDLADGEKFVLMYDDEVNRIKYYHHPLVAVAWNALAALTKGKERGLVTEYTEKY